MKGVRQALPNIYYRYYIEFDKRTDLPQDRLIWYLYYICFIIERYCKVYNILLVDVYVSAFLSGIHDTRHISNCFFLTLLYIQSNYFVIFITNGLVVHKWDI